MGITGLLPFLSKSSRRANVKEYSGQTVAIDAYCWLHKGAFSCADKLVMNEPTLVYVTYCMKFINMLLSHNIKPILVFDGRYLPAKAETENKRRETRAVNRKKGAELLRAGLVEDGRSYLRRSVDITHEMALNLIKECRKRNIDCIVAPYEADAQLAYLNIKDIAQVVITEDSDLLLFGCVRVLFKIDINGNGILIEKDRLHISMGIRHDSFSIDKFRYMCILSGCDYLSSLPGIGLSKARKFINRTSEQNIYEALLKLPVNLQMWNLVVTDEYRNKFIEADKTFKYQLVYDPIKRKQVPLNETENENDFVGQMLDETTAFQLALGNIDPMTLKKVDCYDPDMQKVIANTTNKSFVTCHSSIWNRNYIPRKRKLQHPVFAVHDATKGISITTSVSLSKKRSHKSECESGPELTKEYLFNIYSNKRKKGCQTVEATSEDKEVEEKCVESKASEKSPILFTKKNPFALQSPLNATRTKKYMGALARFNLALESNDLRNSRYFTGSKENVHESDLHSEKSAFHISDNVENSVEARQPDESSCERAAQNGIEGKEFDTEYSPQTTTRSGHSSGENIEVSSVVDREGPSVVSVIESSGDYSSDALYGGDKSKCSQEENLSSVSNCEDRGEKSLDLDRDSGNMSSDMEQQEKTTLTPINGLSVKKFYYTDKVNESDEAQNSPYFNDSRDTNSSKTTALLFPLRTTPKMPLMESKRKCSARNILNKNSQGKQQSLLTRFGFQPRPKIQNERT